ncbi:15634_t:CDS:2 [Racocetra fulgida]|uniref:15634_t:CDS:1 n=1 Tax=Racocetra fulgida TaxID=60492 RepID=A0A9N9B8Z0_9GLOM|nr:15634_t:CDS:2 [Racocetra fulgida]
MNPFPAMILASSTTSSQIKPKKHAGGKRKHYLTKYIITTDEYVNPQKPNDKYCYCLACYELNLEKVKIVNRKKLVRNHLKNCIYFMHKVGGKEQVNNILNKEDSEESSKKLRLDYDKDKDNSLAISKVESKKIDHFLARTPTFLEQAQFEDQILNITITNGWSFRWVEDKSVIAYYHWLNPHLKLPSRKQLAGRILKAASETNRFHIQNKARKDLYGVMIAFDGWKNVINQEILESVLIMSNGETLVWNIIDISGWRKKYEDIMEITEEIFEEINVLEIKINGLVTDSDAAYAASR